MLQYLRHGDTPSPIALPSDEQLLERIRREFDYYCLPDPLPKEGLAEKLRDGEYTVELLWTTDFMPGVSGEIRNIHISTVLLSDDGDFLVSGAGCEVSGTCEYHIWMWEFGKGCGSQRIAARVPSRGERDIPMSMSVFGHELLFLTSETMRIIDMRKSAKEGNVVQEIDIEDLDEWLGDPDYNHPCYTSLSETHALVCGCEFAFVWDRRTGEKVHTIRANSLALIDDGGRAKCWLVGSRLVCTESKTAVSIYEFSPSGGHTYACTTVRVQEDIIGIWVEGNELVFLTSNGRIEESHAGYVYDIETGAKLREFRYSGKHADNIIYECIEYFLSEGTLVCAEGPKLSVAARQLFCIDTHTGDGKTVIVNLAERQDDLVVVPNGKHRRLVFSRSALRHKTGHLLCIR